MKINNFQIENFKKVDLLVVILFFIGVFSFLFFTGTLNSGYHFTDDHEIIRINTDLESTSFLETSANWLKSDLNIRFRPMYYLHRIFEIKLFISDFLLLSLYTGLLASLSFSFFYFGARKLRYTVFESLLFVFLAFVGSQTVIWWRLGPAETIGIFFLGLSFFFMARCVNKDKYLLNTISFGIFLILSSLCKESFVVIIPAFIAYKIWNESRVFDIPFKKSIQNNFLLIVPFAAMIVEIWAIIFVVGTNNLGYAGTSSSTSELLKGVQMIFTREDMLFVWVELLAVVVFLYLLSFVFFNSEKLARFKKSIKEISLPLTFLFLVLLPNLFLYAKSGMTTHYLLPTTLGIAFFIISILKNTDNNILRKAGFLACAVFIFVSSDIAKKTAYAFTSEGLGTNIFLSAVEKNAQSNSKILMVIDPITGYEFTWSIKTYLSSKDIDNLYVYAIPRDYSSDFERVLKSGWDKWFENKTFNEIGGQPDLIMIVYKSQSEGFFDQSNIPESNYTNLIEDSNPHAVYIKK